MTDQYYGLMTKAGLSKTESAIFRKLASRPNEVVSRDELVGLLKGTRPHTLDSHIMAIRKKIAQHDASVTIETITGSGFLLRAQEDGP